MKTDPKTGLHAKRQNICHSNAYPLCHPNPDFPLKEQEHPKEQEVSTGKAIKVNNDNKGPLSAQYNLEEEYLDTAVGLWLIAGFGEESLYRGLLTTKGFEATYDKTGVTLQNGYIEVERKGGGPF